MQLSHDTEQCEGCGYTVSKTEFQAWRHFFPCPHCGRISWAFVPAHKKDETCPAIC